MLEGFLAWIFLFIGTAYCDPRYFIASGVFAVASQLYCIAKKDGAGQ